MCMGGRSIIKHVNYLHMNLILNGSRRVCPAEEASKIVSNPLINLYRNNSVIKPQRG